MLNESSRREIFFRCEKFLTGDYPMRIADRLRALTAETESSERPDFYGTGEIIESFEQEIASLLAKPAGVFMPSGTMAQNIAMRIWCDRASSRAFAVHATSHLLRHEQNAYEKLHNLQALVIGEESRVLALRDFTSADGSAAAIIELPHRELGGLLPEWSELVAISGLCRDRKIALHMDGARLWESAAYYKKSLAEIAALFDSVYVSFYKGLNGIAGAMLLGPNEFIDESKVWQRRHGGNLIALFPYVLSARAGLRERLPKMASYQAKASEFAKVLRDIDGITCFPEVPHTNMMRLTFSRSCAAMDAAFTLIAKEHRVALFFKTSPGRQNECHSELWVGDASLDLSSEKVAELFREAMHLSSKSS